LDVDRFAGGGDCGNARLGAAAFGGEVDSDGLGLIGGRCCRDREGGQQKQTRAKRITSPHCVCNLHLSTGLRNAYALGNFTSKSFNSNSEDHAMKPSGLLVRAFAVLLALSPAIGFAKGSHGGGRTHVKGHMKKNGTYVAPHDRTAPNKTKTDNWSTKGNVNPETGKAGTKSPDPKK
jgi:hypothetical protein